MYPKLLLHGIKVLVLGLGLWGLSTYLPYGISHVVGQNGGGYQYYSLGWPLPYYTMLGDAPLKHPGNLWVNLIFWLVLAYFILKMWSCYRARSARKKNPFTL